VRFPGDEGESCPLVDPAGSGQYVVGPQHEFPTSLQDVLSVDGLLKADTADAVARAIEECPLLTGG
jgi:hypothetical protein